MRQERDKFKRKKRIRSIRIGLASPEKILSWSFGEVRKPETYNYRTLKPEKDGLFSEKIFGPVRDYECSCGKYKKIRYEGTVCERCGVQVTSSKVRRERMGHLRLACPVAHIWFTKSIPNRFSGILDINAKEIEKIIYYVSWIVTDIDKGWLSKNLNYIKGVTLEEIEREKGRKIKLRNLQEVDIFDVIARGDGFTRELAEKILPLKKEAIRPGSEQVHTPSNTERIQTLKKVVSQYRLLSRYVAAKRIVDSSTSEVLIDVGERFHHSGAGADPSVVKLFDSGHFRFTVEDVEATHEKVREIKDIDTKIRSIEKGLSILEKLKVFDRISDTDYEHYDLLKYFLFKQEGINLDEYVKIGMGAEAVKEILERIDLPELLADLREELKKTKSAISQKRAKIIKRIKIIGSFVASSNRPEWMILTVLPVLPPDLRPMVELDGGRFASSDLNDLYRRVINRNNRLQKLITIRAPESILRNEKRMLQEAVDSLIDNGRRTKASTNSSNRALKSLSDMLKGKQGRFRQNLLGKRVDYSGRSVIVVGPKLRLHQCGIPKFMALELFKPFVLRKLIDKSDPNMNIKTAKAMIEKGEDPDVWDKLEEIIRSHPILLNRAPTLHRLSIQAFEPKLIEGKAIQIHPLVCTAYNADFDGDQMAVHVPLSTAAQAEARLLMLSTNNLLLPADGRPIISPSQDMVLGLYYLTQTSEDADSSTAETARTYSSANEALLAYENGRVGLQSFVQIPTDRKIMEKDEEETNGEDYTVSSTDKPFVTTIGRITVNEEIHALHTKFAIPKQNQLPFYNLALDKSFLGEVMSKSYDTCGAKFMVAMADMLKDLGFEISTIAGITVAINDICIPESKDVILKEAEKQIQQSRLKERFEEQKITRKEMLEGIAAIWDSATQRLQKDMRLNFTRLNPVFMMQESGARGKVDQVRQLAAMRGVIVGPSGEILEFPIKSNFREGLTVHEYFVSTHGGRKGLVDTALKTADSGYLTRRLVDVALDVVIEEYDCKTEDGIQVDMQHFEERSKAVKHLEGRILSKPISDPASGETLVDTNGELDVSAIEKIWKAKPPLFYVRSPLTCEAAQGVCARCYGWDLSTKRIAQIGDPVGVVAAQSIGEPGTQLTMRTFHVGGVMGTDITQGLPLVENLFEVRGIKNPVPLIKEPGKVVLVEHYVPAKVIVFDKNSGGEKSYDVYRDTGKILFTYYSELQEDPDLLKRFSRLTVVNQNGREKEIKLSEKNSIPLRIGETVKPGSSFGVGKQTLVETGGEIKSIIYNEKNTFYRVHVKNERGEIDQYDTPEVMEDIPGFLNVSTGSEVKRADLICKGEFDIKEYHQLVGDLLTQLHLVRRIQDIYEMQNVNTNNKHIEIIAREMLKYVRITDPGDEPGIFEGDLLDKSRFRRRVKEAAKTNIKPPKGITLLQGISKASLATESFLSAASFQETTRVLTDVAIEGKIDRLRGLKENVIIGGLIPAGTGKHRRVLLEDDGAGVENL